MVAAGDGGSLQSQSISGFHFRGMIHAEAGPFTLCRGLCLLGENSARGGNAKKKKDEGKNSPAIHGEVSVEHPLAHLLPLNSPGKFQVCELIS